MAKRAAVPQDRIPSPRFGIGEWYGYSFANLSLDRRNEFARIAQTQNATNAPPCPFKNTDTSNSCSKKGGICSLRLYQWNGEGKAIVLEGDDGDLRATCPHRFKQDGTVYKEVSRIMLGVDDPEVTNEVKFLQRIAREDMETTTEEAIEEDNDEDVDAAKEDVGSIDNVLVDPRDFKNWCALEIQTVYFSGRKMSLLFRHIEEFPFDDIPFPDLQRRPDYRSSGPKRLMPQLQIKVPTLRRWGKKMAIVVDEAWFRTNVVDVATVRHLSNADIAWCLVSFDESTDPATLRIVEPALQTLERAVEGLTGGFPVTLTEFEAKISEKVEANRNRRSRRRGN